METDNRKVAMLQIAWEMTKETFTFAGKRPEIPDDQHLEALQSHFKKHYELLDKLSEGGSPN